MLFSSQMKLISWNVNGIRSVSRYGFEKWFVDQNPDIVCVQEIKAMPEQVEETLKHPAGYHSYWHSAKKPGYSGVAVYSKKEPLRISNGWGEVDIDNEGRVLVVEYPKFVLLNCYFPNSQRDHARLPYKLSFCERILKHAQAHRKQGKNVIFCGDFNIAHKEIDLKNPKTNTKNAGFLPEERAWMDQFTQDGFTDAFRKFEQGHGHYTWWSYRPGVRQKNVGWRLDYHFVNQEFADRMKSASIQCETLGSDHCPVVLELKK